MGNSRLGMIVLESGEGNNTALTTCTTEKKTDSGQIALASDYLSSVSSEIKSLSILFTRGEGV